MSTMHTIDGVEVSEDTIRSALKRAGVSLAKPYQFQAGDIVLSGQGVRVIIPKGNDLIAIDSECDTMAKGQEQFRSIGYEKIGTIGTLKEALTWYVGLKRGPGAV